MSARLPVAALSGRRGPAANAVPATVDWKFVYFVYLTDPRSGREILGYVGRTIDLGLRYEGGSSPHMAKNWGFLVTVIDPVAMPPGSTDADLSRYEAELIALYGPPLNIAGNRDPDTGELRTDWALCEAIAVAEAQIVADLAAERGRWSRLWGWLWLRGWLAVRGRGRRLVGSVLAACRVMAVVALLAVGVGVVLSLSDPGFGWRAFVGVVSVVVWGVVVVVGVPSLGRVRERARRRRRARRRTTTQRKR